MPEPLRAKFYCPHCLSLYRSRVHHCGIDGAALEPCDHDPLVGATIDEYRIVARLAEGGMGLVYRAVHAKTRRPYAIKVLLGDHAANRTVASRFRREAKSASKVNHPNVVRVLHPGTTPAGLDFIVMELATGPTLAQMLEERGFFEPALAAAIGRDVAAGLSEAHRIGVVHRDIKPTNIVVESFRGRLRARILDFGIAGLIEGDVTRITATGVVLGTPHYMAPEQAMGEHAGPTADLYALGAVLYEMLTGAPPFVAESAIRLLAMQITEAPKPLPPSGGLEVLVERMLAKDPAARPQSALEVATELDRSLLKVSTVADIDMTVANATVIAARNPSPPPRDDTQLDRAEAGDQTVLAQYDPAGENTVRIMRPSSGPGPGGPLSPETPPDLTFAAGPSVTELSGRAGMPEDRSSATMRSETSLLDLAVERAFAELLSGDDLGEE